MVECAIFSPKFTGAVPAVVRVTAASLAALLPYPAGWVSVTV